MDKLKVIWQYILPQHLLSTLVGKLARCQVGAIKNLLIKCFVRFYKINMDDAVEKDPLNYTSFQDFFVRELRDEMRPIAEDENSVISPVDGRVSQIGTIKEGKIIQAKGFDFSVSDLLGGDSKIAELFKDGSFATLYLSPSDYHRVHMPCDGTLEKSIYVPGKLFAVNKITADNIPNLYARNERVANIFTTDLGPVAVVMVGALIVAGIQTSWAGVVSPGVSRNIDVCNYKDAQIKLLRGKEVGRFIFGSTVIVLFPKDKIIWNDNVAVGQKVRMGGEVGRKAARSQDREGRSCSSRNAIK